MLPFVSIHKTHVRVSPPRALFANRIPIKKGPQSLFVIFCYIMAT